MNFFSFGLLDDLWRDFNRIHRGGFGESPRGLAAYWRNRWLVGAAIGLCFVAMIAIWVMARI